MILVKLDNELYLQLDIIYLNFKYLLYRCYRYYDSYVIIFTIVFLIT